MFLFLNLSERTRGKSFDAFDVEVVSSVDVLPKLYILYRRPTNFSGGTVSAIQGRVRHVTPAFLNHWVFGKFSIRLCGLASEGSLLGTKSSMSHP